MQRKGVLAPAPRVALLAVGEEVLPPLDEDRATRAVPLVVGCSPVLERAPRSAVSHSLRICVWSRDRRSFPPPGPLEATQMTSVLSPVVAAVRAWFDLNDPAENGLHTLHGWLLPPAVDGRALALAPVLSPSAVSSASGKPS